ncbi:hypothetical protein DOY81_007179 [Sarcophaga bullata]|nr:hypothetical protein DOY81_007179 [Sarcophaga bullata]
MFSEKFLFIISLSVWLCQGQEISNSSVNVSVINDNDNILPNTVYLNYTGNINRIIGGRPLNIEEVPFQVALYDKGFFICGGSILNANWILTAAHCVKGGGKFRIRAGSKFTNRGGVLRSAGVVVVNSGYNIRTMQHDIALIRLTKPLKWSKKIKPVKLAKPNFKLPRNLLVSGWGARSEIYNRPTNALRGASVSTVSHNTCKNKFKGEYPVSRLVVCASAPGRDACQGDSGGPLTFKGVQYGIVSYGIGCARKAFPGIYTNIRKQNAWIRKVMQRHGV